MRRAFRGAAILGLIVVFTIVCIRFPSRTVVAPADPAFMEKLKRANHHRSEFPAQKQTLDIAGRVGFKTAALNSIGMELREVGALSNGAPSMVFAMLSHLGGFGEVIWVDQWTNFPVKLPPTREPGRGGVEIPRREAVRAALEAVEASGGCLIKAGEHRYLVARASEREKYEAAINALGWLDGTQPPWVRQK